jgi:hypothetical protein
VHNQRRNQASQGNGQGNNHRNQEYPAAGAPLLLLSATLLLPAVKLTAAGIVIILGHGMPSFSVFEIIVHHGRRLYKGIFKKRRLRMQPSLGD